MCPAGRAAIVVLLPATAGQRGGPASHARAGRIYTATPFYGSRRMQVALQRGGLPVNRKRVQRLMRVMGLEAVGPKPRLSRPHPEQRVYPYLLRDVAIERVDQVWSTDITYIRLRSGFVYLVAILDWFSRDVLAWELSVTVDGQFCEDNAGAGVWPPGVRRFSIRTREPVHQRGVHGSVADGGRADQHGWARPGLGQCVRRAPLAFGQVRRRVSEGLWLGARARAQLGRYFTFYNQERPHQALAYRTPAAVYAKAQAA